MDSFCRLILVLVVMTSSMATALADNSAANMPLANTASILEDANQLIAAERLNEALDLLKSVKADTPKTAARVNVLLGEIYLRLGKPEQASEQFEQAVFSSLDEDSEAYAGLALAQLRLGNLTRAKRHARTAVRSDPNQIDAHLVLAQVEDRSGRVVEARQLFKDLMRDQPANESVVVAYAQFLVDRGELDSATALLAGFMDRYPFAAEAGDFLGLLYWQQGRKTDALKTRANAARAFQFLGNEFRAKAILTWLVAKDPTGRYLESEKPTVPFQVEKRPATPKTIKPVPSTEAPLQVEEEPRDLPALVHLPRRLERPEPLPLPAGARLTTGSGFIVAGGRLVITNHHVVENKGKIAVRSGTGEVRTARVIKVAAKDDLVILELSKPFPENYSVPFGRMIDAKTGSAAVVMGFPMANYFGWQQPSLTEGIVSKASGMSDNPGTFLITSKINKGNSGGPIFDRYGRLIGVVVAKFDKTSFYEAQGYLPEDVNIGIKISRVLSLLNESSQESGLPGGKIDLEDLYQSMLASVVLVAAVKK
jgi:serine protease Do